MRYGYKEGASSAHPPAPQPAPIGAAVRERLLASGWRESDAPLVDQAWVLEAQLELVRAQVSVFHAFHLLKMQSSLDNLPPALLGSRVVPWVISSSDAFSLTHGGSCSTRD